MSTERLNRALYGSKLRVYAIMRRTTYLLTLISVGLLVYAHGMVEDPDTVQKVFYAIDGIFAVFVTIYLLRILYAFERVRFLRRTWFEGTLMAIVFINLVGTYLLQLPIIYNLFDSVDIKVSVELYRVAVSVYMLVLLLIELLETRVYFKVLQFKPTVVFLLSFVFLILLGSGLLMMPNMITSPGSMRYIDALFMATTTSCVTGLVVVDPGTYFTFSGQVVLLMLIQLGGLGILTFATFFVSLMRQGMGIKQHLAMYEILESDSIFSTQHLLRKLVLMTFTIEAVGALIIFTTWDKNLEFVSLGSKIFYSVFHSVSAFCNAGISLYPEGLYTAAVRNSYALHLVIAVLIILGGIGFPTMIDVLSPQSIRARMRAPWKNWRLLTRISIYTSIGLIALGTVGFFLLEYFNTLAHLNFGEAVITSFFQSVTTRTAGYNTVDISALSVPTLLMFIFLMFIGASPGSTGGGIKTTTFLIILLTVWTTIRGKRYVEIGKRTIPHAVSYKAFSVFVFAAILNLLFLFTLTITDSQFDVMRLAIEQVSAFATVGLSTGITAGMSDAGKGVLILSMFIGRVGTLTLAVALSTRTTTTAYKFPETHVPVG
ncbi:TrkH family potassium uptake protein [Pontibacter sp. HSC-36F09]|uniref:TrkH family potassium uptake protein n=1 Tax=Pontibacter sp. HSC-36F09 TaxID=2910966 RepID=UPI00209D7791|nr:potassium transporter TrkG [Pontibacter sp. HSC-36F09]MCP2043734.1 potassium uptake TrkH family protein [Pontibacter sp. HSC-36F09]